MSIREFLRAITRRWPIILIGAVVTAAAAMAVLREDGTHWTRSELVFMAPSSAFFPNSLQTRSEDLIITAGLVGKLVTGPDRTLKYGSTDVTLIGTPHDGDYWLRLPDTGGQWATNYGDQLLLLDVVGDSPDAVEELHDDVVARVRTELEAVQRAQGVAPVNEITMQVSPEALVVHQVGGSRIRALAMTGVIGVAVTGAAVMLLELRASRRRERVAALAER
ncbi:MAG: hypothetical protein WBX17_04210 [Microbacterium sp.]